MRFDLHQHELQKKPHTFHCTGWFHHIPGIIPIKPGSIISYILYTLTNQGFVSLLTWLPEEKWPPSIPVIRFFGFPQRRSHALVGLPNASGENVGRSPAVNRGPRLEHLCDPGFWWQEVVFFGKNKQKTWWKTWHNVDGSKMRLTIRIPFGMYKTL